MSTYQPTLSAANMEGLYPTNETVRLVAHAAVTKGHVYVINTAVVDATTGLLDTTKAMATADGKVGIHVVAMEDIASGAVGEFLLRGKTDVYQGADCAAGAYLAPINAQSYIDDTIATGFKLVGINHVLVGGSAALSPCTFNGVEGFGHSS